MSLPCAWCSRGHGLLRAQAREFSPCSSNFVQGAGLGKGGNCGRRLRSKVAFADDQVEGLAGGGAAVGDGADDLAFEALGVEAALTGDDGLGAGEEGVEVGGVEDEAGAGAVPCAVGPEAAGEPAAAAAHRHAAWIATLYGFKGFLPLG